MPLVLVKHLDFFIWLIEYKNTVAQMISDTNSVIDISSACH